MERHEVFPFRGEKNDASESFTLETKMVAGWFWNLVLRISGEELDSEPKT